MSDSLNSADRALGIDANNEAVYLDDTKKGVFPCLDANENVMIVWALFSEKL